MTRFLYDIETEGQEETFGPSKTQVKDEMHDLQALGLALIELPPDRFVRIAMDERLRAAFDELQRISNHGARRRQAQYIGKLLRHADVDAFRAELADYQKGREQASKGFPDIAKWRERLLADDAALTAWFNAYPSGDTRQLRSLVRLARKEEAAAIAESATSGEPLQHGRYYRELFQRLRAAMEAAGQAD